MSIQPRASAIPLPASLDAFDSAWIEQSLRPSWPTIHILSAEPRETIQGTGTKMIVALVATDEAGSTDLPGSVCIKGGYSPNSAFLMPRGRYVNEAVFYKYLRPLVDVRSPRPYFAEFNESGQTVIVMEDLGARDVHFNLATETLSAAQVASGLRELARIHAKWWNSPELHRIETLGPALPGGGHEARQREPATWQEIISLPRARDLPAFARDGDRMGRALDRLRKTHLAGTLCMLHGDPHIGNSYTDIGGAVGFYDWQTIARGSWAHDVNYWIGSTLSIEDRRHHEKALLADYLGLLAECGGPGIAFDDAWSAFRMHDVYGLFFWTVNPVEMQSEYNNIAVAGRFAAAAQDHGCLEALNV